MVYITGYKLKLPGISSQEDLLNTIKKQNFNIKFKKIEFNNKKIGQIGILDIDKENKFYPPKPELKIMRLDVLAATICIRELIQEANINKKDIEEIDLYVSNGAFVENLFDQNTKNFKNFKKVFSINDNKKRQKKFFRVSPPLLALNTLTNATESYAAQFTGIAGNNTTFGNTSISGFYVIQEAVTNIAAGKTAMAVVGGSNRSGITSLFTHHEFIKPDWRESPGAIFILLESAESVKNSNRKILGKISHIEHGKSVPSLLNKNNTEKIDFLPKSNTLNI